jgi:hypothetical protein
MRKTTLLAALIITTMLAVSTPADAQERAGLGVGIESMLTSEFNRFGGSSFPGSATLTYDAGTLYASGLLTFADIDNGGTVLGLGGRIYFPIHDGDNSDFSVGGGFAFLNFDGPGPGDDDTSFHLEAGGRMRAWLTSNVAMSAGVGIGILLDDDDGADQDAVGILGNLVGSLGITYFFW